MDSSMILKPTTELRWYRYNVTYILQQKWIDTETGEAHWKDVPQEN